ncbi:uncharacterized protein CTHT_0036360 [Thermochaetoides thermophila DSM 1495]|uniref:Glycosyltransferase family 69 protein n=1 Tax=Chaetomium thermophilum (strain DSM 1495 / CBS 144.50 / IMI 039719) TaxID=759272 RepID=G0S7C5_CHATD|nr:hypothetical protein CTHT_0036360 [Thermochaetoides thermophila DSM 1495]EGS21769.1 hypothetical protein CTHT_0036360 [Thermochaetoides thermophila DSM 1495]
MRPKILARRPRIFRSFLSRSNLTKLSLAVLIWTLIEAHVIYYRIARADREARAHAVLHEPIRVFIASLHWNNEKILRNGWNKGVVDLVNTLGHDNVFVSVYESGSWDKSKDALRELDQELGRIGVGRKIVLEETTHADLIKGPPEKEGWIEVSEGAMALRRIPYLSKLRNISLQPLLELAANGTSFHYVLFLGDVFFTVEDIITLLKTNNGHYAAACSLDFSKPPLFYDTFALRDVHGHEHVTQTWPYFRASKSRMSMPTSAFTGIQGLKFRGIDDSLAVYHLEGSECCLIHADNPASRTKGVFLNPAVRVGYNRKAYETVHPPHEFNTGSRLPLAARKGRQPPAEAAGTSHGLIELALYFALASQPAIGFTN